MNISLCYPTIAPHSDDIKQNARNILKFSAWFKKSELAKNLQLTQVLEWLSTAYGYKSFAAFKAQADQSNLQIKNKLESTLAIENEDDALFVKTIDSYLVTPSWMLKHFNVYAEPTPLLLATIEGWVRGKTKDLFANLAAVNALGIKIYRHQHSLSQKDTAIISNATNGGLVDSLFRFTEITNYKNEVSEIEWEVQFPNLPSDDKWLLLDLFVINRPISEADLNIEIPLNEVAKALNAKEIVSFEAYSTFLGNIDRFTSFGKPLYEVHGDPHGDGYEEGIYSEKFKLDEKQMKNKVLPHGFNFWDLVTFDIDYIDQNDQAQNLSIDVEQFFFELCAAKNGFTFLEWEDRGEEHNVLFKLYHKQVVKELVKHQYLLTCLWIANGGALSTEENEFLEITAVMSDIEEYCDDVMQEFSNNFSYYDHLDKAFLDELFAPLNEINIIAEPEKYQETMLQLEKHPVLVAKYNELYNQAKAKAFIKGAAKYNLGQFSKAQVDAWVDHMVSKEIKQDKKTLEWIGDYITHDDVRKMIDGGVISVGTKQDLKLIANELKKGLNDTRINAIAEKVMQQHAEETRKKLTGKLDLVQDLWA